MIGPSTFLSLLWGPVPPGQVLVWRLPSKHSTWFQNFNNLDAFVAAHSNDEIYTGVSLVRHDAKVTGATRTSNVNAAGIAGLWADIDIADPVHKKAALPPTTEAAMEALTDPAPTIIIHSGHGLQCWWLFESPWVFQSTQERVQAQTMSRWWHDRLAKQFTGLGWTLDATHDLARVMRLPGTVNHKAKPVPVEVIHLALEKRIDLVSNLPSPRCTPGVTTVTGVTTPISSSQHLVLNPNAMPPAEKFLVLMDISIKFRRSWVHQRKDLLDQSASAYDMSLATLASQAEWFDQEITDLLITHRREQGEDLKLREDYYQRTINKARHESYQ